MCLRSAVPKIFSSALTLVTFILVVVVAHFNSWDHFLFSFFKTFQTFILGVSITVRAMVRLMVRLGLGLPFTFKLFLPSLLHSHCALLSSYRRQSNKISNLKIHGKFCSHCLFLNKYKNLKKQKVTKTNWWGTKEKRSKTEIKCVSHKRLAHKQLGMP